MKFCIRLVKKRNLRSPTNSPMRESNEVVGFMSSPRFFPRNHADYTTLNKNEQYPFEKTKQVPTLETILKSKLCTWVGSNLFKTALAADSWTDEDERLESKRLSRASTCSSFERIACGSEVKNKIKHSKLKPDIGFYCSCLKIAAW